jgi:hypothetical protein
LFIGSNDFLADPRDVKQLIDELPSEKIVFQDTQVSRLSSFLCVLLDGRRPCSRTTSRTSTSPGRSMRTLASTTKSRIY